MDCMTRKKMKDFFGIHDIERLEMPENDPRRARFMDVCKEQIEIYIKKNNDYGNAFEVSLDKFGAISFVTRQSDKMMRVEQLVQNPAQVESESFEDTVRDMVNYGIMYLMWAKEEKHETDN